MATELTIRLEIDPETRKKSLIIGYESDSDALPMEHEDEHRRLLDSLVERGIIADGEITSVRVERVEKDGTVIGEAIEVPVAERPAIEQGS